MQISFQDAYAEACQALGEEIVKARLIARSSAAGASEPDIEQHAAESSPKPKDRRASN